VKVAAQQIHQSLNLKWVGSGEGHTFNLNFRLLHDFGERGLMFAMFRQDTKALSLTIARWISK